MPSEITEEEIMSKVYGMSTAPGEILLESNLPPQLIHNTIQLRSQV